MKAVRTTRFFLAALFVGVSLFISTAQATPIMSQWSEQLQSKKNSDVEAAKPTAIEDFFFIGSVIEIKEFTRAVMAMAANGLILGNETAWLFRSPTQLAKLALGFNTQI